MTNACTPRLQNWPGGCGKAHDTTVLSQWLLSVLQGGLRENHESQLNVLANKISWQTSMCKHVLLQLIAQKAPADGLALLRWTLEAVDGFFKLLGKRNVWLPRRTAHACVNYCQQFTESWHAWNILCLHSCMNVRTHSFRSAFVSFQELMCCAVCTLRKATVL